MSLTNCNKSISAVHRLHASIPQNLKNYVFTVNGRDPPGLFPKACDAMILDYLKANWKITTPDKAQDLNHVDYRSKVRFADHAYDQGATYHVMVKQDTDTYFDNDMIGEGLLRLYDPVLIELTARRLTYGKTFEELDNIRMEIIRILAQADPDDISSGVQGVDIQDPGESPREARYEGKLPQTLWKAQINVVVHYYVNYYFPE